MNQSPLPKSERLDLLYRLSQTFSSSLDLDQVLNRVIDEVIAATRAERGFVMLREVDDSLSFRVARGLERAAIDEPEFQVSRSVVDWVADQGEPVLTRDALVDDQFGDRPSILALGLRSVLCVPLILKEQISGVVYVDNRVQTGSFTPEDLDLLVAIASSAAIAIENARLHRERLAMMSHHLAQVSAAQEEERRRIARELHDGIGPALASMSMRLGAVQLLLDAENPPVAAEVEDIATLAQGFVRDIRRLIYDLRPYALDELGLVPALRDHLQRVRQEFNIRTQVSAPDEARLPAQVETSLFRLAQEAVNNSIKHAGPEQIEVSLVREGGGIRLQVWDNGQGFDTQAPRSGKQLGLWSMSERVRQLGGELVVESTPGQGTRVSAWVPLEKAGG
jgi:signal transduction histidine kinase